MSETTEKDLWSWVDAPEETPLEVPSGDSVTLVLVAHNGAEWLPGLLDAVASLPLRPAAVVAVDTGSTDATADLLREAAASGTISRSLAGQADWSFGRAVQEALADARGAGVATEWVWLLHDDAVPAAGALGALLRQTALTPGADVVVPMLLEPAAAGEPHPISELGASISHTGRRELGLEPGEIGQGQHDPRPVLGGSTCGLLVRVSRLKAVGGFDDAVPLYRDGVELGWRVTLGGGSVVTCPSARIIHRQAGRSGLRPDTLAARSGRSEAAYDRFLGMRTVLAHAQGAGGVLVLLRLVLGCLLRAVGFLLGKRPDGARDELTAAWDLLRTGPGTRALRRKVSELRPDRAARKAADRLRPGMLSSWATGADLLARSVVTRARTLTRDSDASLDELTGDDFAGSGRTRGPSVLPIIGGVLGLVLTVIAGRALLGSGVVASSGLLPAPTSLAAAFSDYLHRPAGGWSPAPWAGLAALASVPALWPTWAAVLVLFLAVPLAAVAAAWYLRPDVASSRVRWVAAIAYGLVPALIGALSRGQVWLVAVALLLPGFGVALQGWARGRTQLDRLRSPALAALTLTALTAVAPGLWVAGAMALAVVAVRRGRVVAAVVAALAPLAVLAPWLVDVVRSAPGRLLTSPDPLLASSDVVPAWQLLVGRSAGPGLPPLWVSLVIAGLVWLAALLAVALDSRMLAFAGVAVGAVVVAAGLSRLLVALPGGQVRPEVTPWLLIAFAALVAGAAETIDRARVSLARVSFGAGQALVVGVTVLALAGVLAATAWWVAGGAGRPLHRGADNVLPSFVQDSMTGPGRTRTLVVDMGDGQPRWLLSQTDGTTWGDAEWALGPTDPRARDEAVAAVAQIAAARQNDVLADRLAALGVAHVQLRGSTNEVSSALAATPGMTRGGEENGVTVFSVAGRPTRTQVETRDGVVMVAGSITAPTTGTLRLSEADDPRWQVTVGGKELPRAASSDWRPAFTLAGETGPVTATLRPDAARPWVALLQLLGLLAMALLAAPSVRRASDAQLGRRSWVEEAAA